MRYDENRRQLNRTPVGAAPAEVRAEPVRLPVFDQVAFGGNIRRLRAARGWTLRDLSERSNISQSTLSRVETGQITLAFDRVHALATALEADFTKFLVEMGKAPDPDVPVNQPRWRSISRKSEGQHVVQHNADFEYVCTDFLYRKMVALFATVTVRSLEEHGPFITHPGEEFMYVLSGTAVLATEYYEPVTLQAGDCMQHDPMTPHALYSTSEEPARMLVCVTDPRWED